MSVLSLLLTIKTFVISEAPSFIKEVIVTFAEDGFVAGIKRICGSKKDPMKEAIGNLERKIDFIASQYEASSNTTIREIAQKLRVLISSLHIKTTHDILLQLRTDIPASDQFTLSVVDYALGCCSRYIDKDACVAEYSRAYTEMIGAGRRDPEIIAGKLYCLCVEKKKTEALRMANGLKELDRTHIWAWVPELVFSDNFEESFQMLPDVVKTNPAILANACILPRESTSLGVDVFLYKVDGPESLSFDNIPIWLFNLSVLINRYLREWNADAFAGDTPVGPFCKELYDYSSRFLQLSEKTELGEVTPDIYLFNTITSYKIHKETDLLNTLKQCKSSVQFLPVKQLSYVLFLSKEGRFEDAKRYLKGEEIINDASIYNIRFYLAVVTADEDYARETIRELIDKNVVMPSDMLVFLLMALKDFTATLRDDAIRVSVEGETDARVYQELCRSFGQESVDIQFLIEHQGDMAIGLRPFVSIALFDAGLTQESLDLSESCVKDGVIDFCNHVYYDLLKRSKSYSRLNTYLRKVREGGFIDNPIWLRDEYLLARKEEDFPRMLQIAEALYNYDPQNASYYTCYLTMQYQNGHFDEVKKLYSHIREYSFSPDAATEVFNALLLSDLVEESIDFLYTFIRNNEPNEQIILLYHSICMNPKTAPIIRKEYDVVVDGAYVHYKRNGEYRTDVIVTGQRTDCMIGKKKGETITIKDRMGRDEIYEIVLILNKYSQLQEEIYSKIAENKLNSAFSFSMEDLKECGDMIEGLSKLAGHDEQWQSAHNAALEEYKQGKQTISCFFHGDDYFAEIYNLLFGSFKVFNIPRHDFEGLYEKRGLNLNDQEYVLDLSSLVLLFELHLKFGLVYSFPLIIPQGIVHLINGTIAKEEHAMPAGIYQSVVDQLAPIENLGETWFITRLKALKSWIEDTITVEVAHEMLDVEMEKESVFDKSRYLTLEYQSAVLTMRGGRVFVSDDMAMTVVFGNGFPVADVNLLVHQFCQERYVEVSRFFVETDVYGEDIDVEYVVDQYERHARGEESSFVKCKENLSFNLFLYPIVLNVCSRIMSKAVISPADSLTVDAMLNSMFGKYNRNTSFSILASSCKQLPHLKHKLLTAFKTVHPLF